MSKNEMKGGSQLTKDLRLCLFNPSGVCCHWLWKKQELESISLQKKVSLAPLKWIWFVSFLNEIGLCPRGMARRFAVIQRMGFGNLSYPSKGLRLE